MLVTRQGIRILPIMVAPSALTGAILLNNSTTANLMGGLFTSGLSTLAPDVKTRNVLFPFGGTLANFRFKISASAGQSIIVTVYNKAVITNMTVTLAAGVTSASDLVNIVTVAALDDLQVRIKNNGIASTITVTAGWSVEFTPT